MDRHIGSGIKTALLVLLVFLLIVAGGDSALPYKSGWPKSLSRTYYSPTLAAIDGDGDKEVLIPGLDGKIYILDASGNTLAGWPANVESEATSPAVGTLDGRSLKIIAGSSKVAHQTAAYLGGFVSAWNSNGLLNWSSAIDTAIQSSPSIADLNGDGQLEVIFGAWDNNIYALNATGGILWSASTLGQVSSSPAVADIDRDGNPEVVIGSDDGNLYALRNNGAIYWSAPVGISGRSTAVIGDINFDGTLEVVVGTCSNIYAISNTGSVLWSASIQTCYPALGDIDRDGDLEIIAGVLSGYPNNKIHILYANGSTMMAIPLRGSDASNYERVVSTPIIGDTDSDGYPEIIVTTNSITESLSGRLYAFDRFGNELWHEDIGNLDATTRGPSPALEDLDNDGLLEVIAPSTTGTVHVFQLSAGKGYLPWPMYQRDAAHTGLYDLPLLKINSPTNNGIYRQDESISFSAQGFTSRGGQPSFVWTSSINGALGSTSSFTRSGLSAGSHVITATAIDERGRNVSISMTIQVINAPPTASITSPNNGAVFQRNSVVSFTGVGNDPTGVIAKYEWDFEDDGIYDYNSTTSGNTTRVYPTIGNYTARFRVTDADGSTGTASVFISIINDPPIAMINLPSDGSEFKFGRVVSFEGSAYDSDGSIASYLWNSSMDGVLSMSSYFNKSDLSIGTHLITFIATDNNGAKDSDSVSITIKPINAPTATIVQPLDGSEFSANELVSFIGNGSDIDGIVISYNWTSNLDGALSTSTAFNTASLSIGDHVITLVVTDDDGLTGSAGVRMEIKRQVGAPPPGGGGGGGPLPGIPPLERIKNAQDLIAGNRGLFLKSELYVASSQLSGVLGSLGVVPIPKDEAKAINRITAGGVRALQGDPYEIASDLLLRRHTSLEMAIVSRGDLQVDSLAGLVHARHLGIPIIIVEPNGIPTPMKRALSALGVKSTIVLGGPVAVSNAVGDELKQIERIAGKDRYETAVKIAEAHMMRRTIDTVVVTDGMNPNADAAVAAVLYNAPIIYVKGDDIPVVTAEFLRRNKSLSIKAVGISDAAYDKLSGLISGR